MSTNNDAITVLEAQIRRITSSININKLYLQTAETDVKSYKELIATDEATIESLTATLEDLKSRP